MTGKCETRTNARTARTKTNRPGEHGGVSPSRATPPVDVNYCRFQCAEYLPEEDQTSISRRIISLCEVLLYFIQSVSVNCVYIFCIISLIELDFSFLSDANE